MTQKIIHEVIGNAAKGICESFYEDAARDNTFYRMNPRKRAYINKNWRHFIDVARHNLLVMLTATREDGTPRYPEQMREPIYEALVLDGVYKTQPQARALH